jgi:hypothetical protein
MAIEFNISDYNEKPVWIFAINYSPTCMLIARRFLANIEGLCKMPCHLECEKGMDRQIRI